MVMPIKKEGWELHIIRREEQKRSDGRRRTVGAYKVFHDGVAQIGTDFSGMVAEAKGPGANSPAGNGRRVKAGRYAMATQDGMRYDTFGYKEDDDPDVEPKPGLELTGTEDRSEILIHPGQGFLASIGCINPCTNLPNANETIDYVGSRQRVIAIIEDMKSFLGNDFPKTNGKKIPRTFVVIDGEPAVAP
jgi:hypothetical protein